MAAGTVLAAPAAYGLRELLREPEEWETVPKPDVLPLRDLYRRRIVGMFDDASQGRTRRNLFLDDGFLFATDDRLTYREFHLDKVTESKDGEALSLTYDTLQPFLDREGIRQIDVGEEHVKFFGASGMITLTRADVNRVFDFLKDAQPFSQPLIAGSLSYALKVKKIGFIIEREGTCDLHFQERAVPMQGEFATVSR